MATVIHYESLVLFNMDSYLPIGIYNMHLYIEIQNLHTFKIVFTI